MSVSGDIASEVDVTCFIEVRNVKIFSQCDEEQSLGYAG